MVSRDFFSGEQVIGKFHGFQRCGMEFHANVVFFSHEEFQCMPLYGQFLLIQLDKPSEALLGRIVSLHPVGALVSRGFEGYQLQALRKRQRFLSMPWQDELKYKGNILILGVLKSSKDGRLLFVPSHRRQPHCNSLIAFPTGDVLQEIGGTILMAPLLVILLLENLSMQRKVRCWIIKIGWKSFRLKS